MAVPFTGIDSFFQRIGRVEDLRTKVNTHQLLIETEISDILDEFDNDRKLSQELQSLMEGMKASAGTPVAALRQVAAKTLVEMIHTDNVQASKDVPTAFTELVDQMIGAGSVGTPDDDINANTVSASQTSYSGTGNGAVVISVEDNQDFSSAGEGIQTTRAEDIVIKCTRDTQVTGTAARDEVFSVKGELAIRDPANTDWPGGSGLNSSLRVLSSDEDARESVNRTLLVNGNMEDFATTDNLDNWTAVVGAYGTNILEEGTITHRGSKALEIVGDGGGTLVYLEQKFNTSGQSTAKMKPETKYILAVALRDSGAGLLAGTIRISVQDDSDDSLIQTDAHITQTQAQTTNAYAISTVTFNTPKLLPTTLKIVIELTVAATNTESFFIDDVILAPMSKFGPGDGPYIAIIPGATNFVRDDKSVWAVANNKAGLLMQGVDRLFSLHNLTLRPQLPHDTGGGETINDNLIA